MIDMVDTAFSYGRALNAIDPLLLSTGIFQGKGKKK